MHDRHSHRFHARKQRKTVMDHWPIILTVAMIVGTIIGYLTGPLLIVKA